MKIYYLLFIILQMLKPGDIITAYDTGYHVVLSGEDSLIYYRRVLNSKGLVVKSKKEQYCHLDYCKKVNIKQLRREFAQKIVNIKYQIEKYKSLEES